MPRTLFIASFALAVFFTASAVHAQTEISFPVAELGNCGSKSECRTYCNDAANAQACISFGESRGLIKKEEAEKAREFVAKPGPGGCKGVACRAYCEDASHAEECLKFAEENGLMRASEAQLIRDIRKSGGPGGCINEKSCRAYCSDAANAEACRKFAEERGLLSARPNDSVRKDIEKRVESDKKIQEILAEKGGPGGCTDVASCRAYCSDSANSETCLSFAKEAKLIDSDQFEKARKVIRTAGPGGCKGESCKEYCEDAKNAEECLKFAKEQGLISEERAERAESFQSALKSGAGPGGCTDTQSCRTFCAESANAEECKKFAEMNGFARMKVNAQDDDRRPEIRKEEREGDDDSGRISPERLREICAKDAAACAKLKEMMNAAPTDAKKRPEVAPAVRPTKEQLEMKLRELKPQITPTQKTDAELEKRRLQMLEEKREAVPQKALIPTTETTVAPATTN